MIGKGDDRGRWIFPVIAAFALLGKFLPGILGMSRDTVQTALVLLLLPVGLLTLWLLKDEKPAAPTDAAPTAPAESSGE